MNFEDIRNSLSPRGKRLLRDCVKSNTIEEFLSLNEKQILIRKNCGQKTVKEIQKKQIQVIKLIKKELVEFKKEQTIFDLKLSGFLVERVKRLIQTRLSDIWSKNITPQLEKEMIELEELRRIIEESLENYFILSRS